MHKQIRKFFISIKLDILNIIMNNKLILKQFIKCRPNERNKLVENINNRFYSNLNLEKITNDEKFRNMDNIDNIEYITHYTALENIINIIKYENELNINNNLDMQRNVINNYDQFINVKSNYDATLPNMETIEKQNYYMVEKSRNVYAYKNGELIYNGKYKNIPETIIENMNTNRKTNNELIRNEIKFIEEFKRRNKGKILNKSILDVSNNLASYLKIKKPIFKTVIPVKFVNNTQEINLCPYSNKTWKEWYGNFNINYNILRIIKIYKNININRIKYLIDKYNIHAIMTKFKIYDLNINEIIGDYYIYNLYNIISIGDNFENTFFRENSNGALLTRVEDGITIISKIVHTNMKISIKNTNNDALRKLNKNIKFIEWNKYNWNNKTINNKDLEIMNK